jgi:hypothetical protein
MLMFQLLQQATPTVSNPLDGISDGGLLEMLLGMLTSSFGGEGMFGVLVGGATLFAFYLAGEGDLAAPTVLLVLAGAFLWPVLPGAYAGFARSLLILGLASGFIAIGRRYVLDPGAR